MFSTIDCIHKGQTVRLLDWNFKGGRRYSTRSRQIVVIVGIYGPNEDRDSTVIRVVTPDGVTLNCDIEDIEVRQEGRSQWTR